MEINCYYCGRKVEVNLLPELWAKMEYKRTRSGWKKMIILIVILVLVVSIILSYNMG